MIDSLRKCDLIKEKLTLGRRHKTMPLQNNGSAVLEKNLAVKANLCRQGLERTHKNFLAASLNEQKETFARLLLSTTDLHGCRESLQEIYSC